MTPVASNRIGIWLALLGIAILLEVPCQLPAQQTSLRDPDLPRLQALPVGGKHVRSIRLINIPDATSGGAQAAIVSEQSIYLAGKAWNKKDNEESLWLWRLDGSGERLLEKRLARQENTEEMRIVGLLPGARTFSQGGGDAGATA
jgi:hypothetical protein